MVMALVVPSTARFDSFAGKWWWNVVGVSGGEVRVAGDADGPFANMLDLAGRAFSTMDTMCLDTAKYIETALSNPGFRPTNGWEFQWFEVGLSRCGKHVDCELFIGKDGDTYGLWSVRFRWQEALTRFVPSAVTRQSW
jgi:hypothetical protein